jgi:hypothetical protein
MVGSLKQWQKFRIARSRKRGGETLNARAHRNPPSYDKKAFCDDAIRVKHVVKLCRELENGRTNIYDERTGQSTSSRTDVTHPVPHFET